MVVHTGFFWWPERSFGDGPITLILPAPRLGNFSIEHRVECRALGHQMLRTIFAMLSKKTHYVDKSVDYEAPMVAHNAPRWLRMLVQHGFVSTQGWGQRTIQGITATLRFLTITNGAGVSLQATCQGGGTLEYSG